MVTSLAIVFVIVAVFLILLIMIQDPKGGGGGLFGSGGSNSVLGASGTTDFITKLTRYVAIIFGVLCIGITLAVKPPKAGVFSKIPAPVVDQKAEEGPTEAQPVVPQPAAQPATPETPAQPAKK